MKVSRRSFVLLPVLLPFRSLAAEDTEEHTFHYDHVLGTSLDLAVWLRPAEHSRLDAERGVAVVLSEIERLARILSTYDENSEIRAFERNVERNVERNGRGGLVRSAELTEVFALYDQWSRRTDRVLSIRPAGPTTPLNVDALGKAYIIDRAAAALHEAIPSLRGLTLNIGGDIVVRGRDCEIGVTDPRAAHDNAEPLTRISVNNEAVATSGVYSRGPHLIDGRTGKAPHETASSTVIARDAVTANALATTLCILGAREGMELVRRIPGAEALRIGPTGETIRTAGFSRRERVTRVRQSAPAAWPEAFEVAISITLTTPNPRLDRAYAAFWVEDMSGRLVRAIVLWGNKREYHPDMTGYWKITGGDAAIQYRVTRATRAPGTYRVVWNGMDEQNKPVLRGTYRIIIETHRYRGEYAKTVGPIVCESEPTTVTLPDRSVNYEAIKITYGPKPPQE